MKGLLLNWFDDWGLAIKNGLGDTGLLILMVAFLLITLFLFQSVIRESINKTKIKIKWAQVFFMIVFGLFTAWFVILLTW